MSLKSFGFWLTIAACAAVGTAAADDLRAFMLGSSCLSCHGDAAPSGRGIPDLKTRDAAFIRDAMRAFRLDERENTVMSRLARGYSDAEIDLIAAWLAGRGR